jgi:hypothetical protein
LWWRGRRPVRALLVGYITRVCGVRARRVRCNLSVMAWPCGLGFLRCLRSLLPCLRCREIVGARGQRALGRRARDGFSEHVLRRGKERKDTAVAA